MNVPKFIRRWKYKQILKKIDKLEYSYTNTFLCIQCKWSFPFIDIKHYPELWNRRVTLNRCTLGKEYSSVWFYSDKERRQYVQEALDLVTNKNK